MTLIRGTAFSPIDGRIKSSEGISTPGRRYGIRMTDPGIQSPGPRGQTRRLSFVPIAGKWIAGHLWTVSSRGRLWPAGRIYSTPGDLLLLLPFASLRWWSPGTDRHVQIIQASEGFSRSLVATEIWCKSVTIRTYGRRKDGRIE